MDVHEAGASPKGTHHKITYSSHHTSGKKDLIHHEHSDAVKHNATVATHHHVTPVDLPHAQHKNVNTYSHEHSHGKNHHQHSLARNMTQHSVVTVNSKAATYVGRAKKAARHPGEQEPRSRGRTWRREAGNKIR